jgi:hypothetical protein
MLNLASFTSPDFGGLSPHATKFCVGYGSLPAMMPLSIGANSYRITFVGERLGAVPLPVPLSRILISMLSPRFHLLHVGIAVE